MNIEEIAKIIEESSREIIEDTGKDCLSSVRGSGEFHIKIVVDLLDHELDKIRELSFNISRGAFSFDEPIFYKRLDAIDKHLNAVRTLAAIKRYLESPNRGLL